MRGLYAILLIAVVFVSINFIIVELVLSQQQKNAQIKILEDKVASLSKERRDLSKKLTEAGGVKQNAPIPEKERDVSPNKVVERKEDSAVQSVPEKTKKVSYAQLNVVEQAESAEEFFDAGNQKDQTVVHLVPHSHLDAGWLLTMEGYYKEQVKSILDTLLPALDANRNRTFAWVEVGFLERWWRDARETDKQKFRDLVSRKQIELTMGGWVSPDEATVNYHEFINQLTLGHKFLQDEIGKNAIPTVGWQVTNQFIPFILEHFNFLVSIFFAE